jgi:hypothetical protein
MWRRTLQIVLGPIVRFIARRMPVDDPWARDSIRVPVGVFGSGGRRDFGWFFEGESKVRVQSLADIQDWLSSCDYVSDTHLFQEPDFWQHPRTFEQLRRGDCEDFALWAWRKLVELDYDAEFVVGRTIQEPHAAARIPGGRHAWVMFREKERTYLFEPTQRDRMIAVQELHLVRHKYIPEFGVGRNRRTFPFAGYLLSIREQHEREGVGEAAP